MAAGFASRAGFKREATLYTPTWPSTSPAVLTGLLPLLSETVNVQLEQSAVSPVNYRGFVASPISHRRLVNGDLSVNGTFSGLEFLLTASLGFMAPAIGGVEMPEEVDTGVYRHLIEVDNVLDTQPWLADEGWVADTGLVANQRKVRRGTYAIDKTVALWEAKSCMVSGLIFQTNPAATTFTVGLVGYDMTFAPTVGNDLTALSCPKNDMDFRDAIFYLSDTLPLTSGNIVSGLVGLGFSLENNLRVIQTRRTGKFIDEPARGGPVSVAGNFALPFFNGAGNQLQEWVSNGTNLYGMLEFIGQDLGDYDETFRIWFPSMRLISSDMSVSGPEQVQQTYEFVASRPSETPEGFPENIKGGPVMIEIINVSSAHALL